MHLRPVQQEDLPAFARVVGTAMWHDEIMAYVAPHKDKYPDSFFRHCLYRAKLRWYRGELLFVAVSDENDPDWTGKEVFMGYCGYSTNMRNFQKPVRGGWLGSKFENFALYCEGRYSRLFRLNRSCDPAAEDHFRSTLAVDVWGSYFESMPSEVKQKVGDQHWELELLGTHPDYRRRGVGKMMLQWGFDRARKDQAPLVLVASVMGEKLYLNAGFREFKRIGMIPTDEPMKDHDFGQGVGKDMSWAAMVWEPEGFYENPHDQRQNSRDLR